MIVMMTRLGVDDHCAVGSIGRGVAKSRGGRGPPIGIWVHERALGIRIGRNERDDSGGG